MQKHSIDVNKINSFEEMKGRLDYWVARYNVPAFVETDPVQFPRGYSLRQDIEVAALLTATITWGKRSLILKSAARMLRKMGASPYDYVMCQGYEKLGSANIHRTFFEYDMAYICRGLYNVYKEHDSLEALFTAQPGRPGERLWRGIEALRAAITDANGGLPGRSLKHISNPASSACKRLHLALKWLVRDDGKVDIGLWKNISPSELFIPLDVHVGKISRALGLLERKQDDRKAVEELTATLRTFNAEDPVVYDFALFGAGEDKQTDFTTTFVGENLK